MELIITIGMIFFYYGGFKLMDNFCKKDVIISDYAKICSGAVVVLVGSVIQLFLYNIIK